MEVIMIIITVVVILIKYKRMKDKTRCSQQLVVVNKTTCKNNAQ